MALTRAVVTVRELTNSAVEIAEITMPDVMGCPIRPDIVSKVHNLMRCNSRQPYAVKPGAGYGYSAESWGTGRAVARIPRVAGGGTHRAGEGAFGNMCRGGGMFNPTRIWRRWHRKTNLTMRRHAVVSALAASGVPALVMARGHRIEKVPEVPLVVSNEFEKMKKTKEAVAAFKSMGLEEELAKVSNSKTIRAGRGKMRNRRYSFSKGPLVVYVNDDGMSLACRNIPGVELCNVNKLNLLKLAPGGQLGRMIVWTAGAFERLQEIYGTYETGSTKKGYTLPRALMTNADLARIINSNEIQSAIRPAFENKPKGERRGNGLKNKTLREKLDPSTSARLKRIADQQSGAAKKMKQ